MSCNYSKDHLSIAINPGLRVGVFAELLLIWAGPVKALARANSFNVVLWHASSMFYRLEPSY